MAVEEIERSVASHLWKMAAVDAGLRASGLIPEKTRCILFGSDISIKGRNRRRHKPVDHCIDNW